MLRSEVNAIIEKSDAFMRQHGFVLPPFAYWSPDELKARVASGHPVDPRIRGSGGISRITARTGSARSAL